MAVFGFRIMPLDGRKIPGITLLQSATIGRVFQRCDLARVTRARRFTIAAKVKK